MTAPLKIDTKLPLMALGGGIAVAIVAHYGLQSRVDVLESKTRVTELQLEKQDSNDKAILVTLGNVEKTMVAVNGRLEKIEYRLDQVEKGVASLDSKR